MNGRHKFLVAKRIQVSWHKLAWLIADIRYRLYRLSSRIFLGKLSGGAIGKNIFRDLEESSRIPRVACRIREKRLISKAHVQQYAFPESFPPWFRRSEAFSARYQYLLSDVAVSPRSGVVWIPETGIIQQSVGSLQRLYGSRRGIIEPILPLKKLDCTFPIVVAAGYSYYHWLMEILPEILHAINYNQEAHILLNQEVPHYIEDSIDFFVNKSENRIHKTASPVKVSNLILTPRWVNSGFIPVEDISILKNTISGKIGTTERQNEKLYISRRRTKVRAFEGENKLEAALEKRRFRVVYLETLKFHEQMLLCASARFIVAPHGAGLSNMIAAKPPVHIHEIFPSNWLNDCYARLAIQLGYSYSYTIASPSPSGRMTIPIDDVLSKVDHYISEFT